jgi:aspartate kinase
MAGALNELGVKSKSWMNWQIPILTTGDHANSRIININVENINTYLSEGGVAIIPGFQGISSSGDITTIGRGGSDASAVAIAKIFNTDSCEIYTDVDGVSSTDPNKVPVAKKIDKISYEEMLELASLVAKVLQTRSVEMAMRFKVKLRVLSSFEEPNEQAGTLVCDEEEIMESNVVSGIAYSRDEAKMTLVSIADRPGIAAAIFGLLSDAGINVDMIIQNIAEAGRTDMTFSCPIDQVSKAEKSLNNAKKDGLINFQDLLADKNVAKISAVGIGMRSQSGVAAKMFKTLSDEGINIKVIATSEIKISVLVDRKYLELAVQSLHDAFELDQISS